MAHAWMPGARRIRAATDGGPLIGGAPRAVWLTLGPAAGTGPGAVSVQSAAQRLISERRQCHLIWDPLTGDAAQLISALRAGRALGAPGQLDWAPGLDWEPGQMSTHRDPVNAEGRVCVQIGVLGHPGEPFTAGPLVGVEAIVAWLDTWGVPRRWPSGRPEGSQVDRPATAAEVAGRRSRAQWARGGHFGASQVPACHNAGPGAIDVDKLTGPHGLSGPHGLPVRACGLPSSRAKADALPIPALVRPRGAAPPPGKPVIIRNEWRYSRVAQPGPGERGRREAEQPSVRGKRICL